MQIDTSRKSLIISVNKQSICACWYLRYARSHFKCSFWLLYILLWLVVARIVENAIKTVLYRAKALTKHLCLTITDEKRERQ